MEEPNTTVTIDESLEGWGAYSQNVEADRRWQVQEGNDHINVFELRAIFLALQSLVFVPNNHVRILTDNTAAMAYIQNMGQTRSVNCNMVAKQIWEWPQCKNI